MYVKYSVEDLIMQVEFRKRERVFSVYIDA